MSTYAFAIVENFFGLHEERSKKRMGGALQRRYENDATLTACYGVTMLFLYNLTEKRYVYVGEYRSALNDCIIMGNADGTFKIFGRSVIVVCPD